MQAISDECFNATATRVVPELPASAPADLPKPGFSGSRQFNSQTGRFTDVIIPTVGSDFLGFQLFRELGRGAFGVVFLARQEDLANRLIALKVSADLNAEPDRLAQLQHTNIVPIYSVHRNRSLQAICMPYFGCATIGDICRSLSNQPTLPSSGRFIVTTMQGRESTLPEVNNIRTSNPVSAQPTRTNEISPVLLSAGVPSDPGAAHAGRRAGLERMGYVDAVLWIGSRLADGLAHAHERGIIHRDLKPANILLTEDGQPMLLDFNVAEDVKQRHSADSARVGGTLPYMSPEQLALLISDPSSGQISAPLDGRSDVYSLGLILYELLSAQHPFPLPQGSTREILPILMECRHRPIPSLRSFNSVVSPAVESIILHCLTPDRDNRYPSALALKEDIDRQLANLPLLHAPERSWRERAGKWARRHPRLVSPLALAMAGTATLLLIVSATVALSLEGRKRQFDIRREAAVRQFDGFQKQFHNAEMLLSNDDPEQVRRGVEAGLEVLLPYDVLSDADWSKRPAVADLPVENRVRLTRDVGELAFLLARAPIVQRDASDPEQARQLQNLAAASLGQEGQSLLMDQKADLVGPQEGPKVAPIRQMRMSAKEREPETVRFLLASEQVTHGHFREALEILKELVRLAPSQYSVWALKGRCHEQLGEPTEAIGCYSTCIALRPNFAQPYVSRAAVVHNSKRDYMLMLADLDQALQLDPGHQIARIDRSLALSGLGRNQEALADLDRVLAGAHPPTRVYFLRADVRQRLGDAKGAKEDRATGLKEEPTDAPSWIVRGLARVEKDPAGALADFREAEKRNPRSVDALMNQAYVLGEVRRQPREALEAIDRLVKNHPDNGVARATRGVLLVRLSRVQEAMAEAKACLADHPTADIRYRVACIYALASVPRPGNAGDPALLRESERFLASALLQGWGYEYVLEDEDLAPLRQQMGFGRLLEVVRMLKQWEH
jgi:serine/threonine protein kinase/predicted Zn-dependent protease